MKKPGQARSPEEIAAMEAHVGEPNPGIAVYGLLRAAEAVDENDTDDERIQEITEYLFALEKELGEDKLRTWLPEMKKKIEEMKLRVTDPVEKKGYELVIAEINKRTLS